MKKVLYIDLELGSIGINFDSIEKNRCYTALMLEGKEVGQVFEIYKIVKDDNKTCEEVFDTEIYRLVKKEGK